MTDTLEDELREAGWTSRERGSLTLWIKRNRTYDSDPLELIHQWIRSESSAWDASDARGKRNTVNESPFDDEQWFLKQYHHGGLLAREEDVTYRYPSRFQSELLASVKASSSGLNVPSPRGLLYEETDDGYEGYYFSRFEPSEAFTKTLRSTGNSRLPEKAGEILASLHDLGIDHGDFHVGNLRIDEAGDVLITDFDPVNFRDLNQFRRRQRIERFVRSLRKRGFTKNDTRNFRAGYRRGSSQIPSSLTGVLKPINTVKNSLSDLIYLYQDRNLGQEHLEKILVRTPNWLGDAVMSLPLIEALAEMEVDPIVDVAVREPLSAVYEHHECVEKIWELPDDKSLFMPEVQPERYSSCVIIPKSLRTGIQAFFSGIPRRIGFSTQGRSLFLTDRVELDGRDRLEHHAKLYFRLLEDVLSVPDELTIEKLNKPDLGSDHSDIEEDYLAFHPGSAYGPAKRWPPDHYRELLEMILSKTDFTLVAMGVQNEKDIAQDILDPIDSDRIVSLVGETTLEEAMVLLAESEGSIANDSGLMHLSAALGTPTVGIFGSSDPGLTHPVGQFTSVLYEDVECSPCFERTCPRDDDLYKCLTRIEPEEVYSALVELING